MRLESQPSAGRDFVNGHARKLSFASGITATTQPKRVRFPREEDSELHRATILVTRTIQFGEHVDCVGHFWGHRNIINRGGKMSQGEPNQDQSYADAATIAAARAIRSFYLDLTKEGFTEAQVIELLKGMLSAQVKP